MITSPLSLHQEHKRHAPPLKLSYLPIQGDSVSLRGGLGLYLTHISKPHGWLLHLLTTGLWTLSSYLPSFLLTMTTTESRGSLLGVAMRTDCPNSHQVPPPCRSPPTVSTAAPLPSWEGMALQQVQSTLQQEDCLLGQAKHIYQAQFKELS